MRSFGGKNFKTKARVGVGAVYWFEPLRDVVANPLSWSPSVAVSEQWRECQNGERTFELVLLVHTAGVVDTQDGGRPLSRCYSLSQLAVTYTQDSDRCCCWTSEWPTELAQAVWLGLELRVRETKRRPSCDQRDARVWDQKRVSLSVARTDGRSVRECNGTAGGDRDTNPFKIWTMQM